MKQNRSNASTKTTGYFGGSERWSPCLRPPQWPHNVYMQVIVMIATYCTESTRQSTAELLAVQCL